MNEREVIRLIISNIEDCLRQLKDLPIDDVACSIVGRTWGHDDPYIMDLDPYYPNLVTIADLAADIEMIEEDTAYRRELWQKLLINFEALKRQVAEESADKAK